MERPCTTIIKVFFEITQLIYKKTDWCYWHRVINASSVLFCLLPTSLNVSPFSKLFCVFYFTWWTHVRGPLCPPWYIAFVSNRVAYYVFILQCVKKYKQIDKSLKVSITYHVAVTWRRPCWRVVPSRLEFACELQPALLRCGFASADHPRCSDAGLS